MKRFFLAIGASAFLLVSQAQTLLPVRDIIGRLFVSVDPRMELLGAVQAVAGYPLCTRDTPYSDSVTSYFAAFAGSDAVKCTKKLLRDGFAYDAPAGQMLYYSFPAELKLRQPYSEYLGGRAGGEKNLRHYRTALQRFAEESDFARFWTQNEAFYRELLDEFIHTVIRDVDVVGLNPISISNSEVSMLFCARYSGIATMGRGCRIRVEA